MAPRSSSTTRSILEARAVPSYLLRMRSRLLLLACLAGSCARDEGPRSNLDVHGAAVMRQACAFKAGMTTGLTVSRDTPIGDEVPIDTIVILMMENRSFDHILGALPEFGQTDVDVAKADVTNPDSQGNAVQRFHNPSYCFGDTNHEWDGSHTEWDGGKNDGFVIANEGKSSDGTRAMGYYDGSDLPWLYAAANAYTISDRHFCGILGPTFPNREYLYAATSYGRTSNAIFSSGMRGNIMTTIEAYNAQKGVKPISWGIYYEGVPGLGVFLDTLAMYLDHTNLGSQFFTDAAAGMLPNVVFLDPNLRDEWGGGDDDHPPGDPQTADQFMAKVVQAVTTSPQWPHLALIITWDEHGGLYDHVAPPAACPPDDLPPMVPAGQTAYDFARYGFRVPLIVVSPYARPHYVSHVTTDHSSIIRFVERRFRLPAMSNRDANADPLQDMFDFSKPALLKPPSLPTAPVNQDKLQGCEAQYPLKPTNFFPDMGPPPDMAH
jgi:phospholipase C